MKKIGIFLAYAPEEPIKNQGIGRLIGFLLSGFLEEEETEVIIAAPGWYKNSLESFLEDQQIFSNRVQLLTTQGIPYILRVRNLLKRLFPKKREKRNFIVRLLVYLYNQSFKYLMKWLSTTSTLIFIAGAIIFSVLAIVFSPIILIGALSVLAKKINFNKVNKLKDKIFIKLRIKKLVLPKTFIHKPLKSFKNNLFAHKTYNEIRARELRKLIYLINQRKDITIWFVPSLFWPEIEGINTCKVVAAPDIVFVEFPTLFCETLWQPTYERIANTLKVGDHFICYSDHVKQEHLIKSFKIPPNKISVIHHGFVELDKFFKYRVSWQNEALEILKKYQIEHLASEGYLSTFNLKSIKFIFYSSQIRPHKNFINLIRAYEILLRKRFLNFKLVLTADVKSDETTLKYIMEKRLHRDVIWLPDIPSNVLAALNHLAICSVNPTLFEGGFPFTFTEAYSVLTPSLMSDIPVVSSMIDDEELKRKMLFNPYDVEDMAKKIEWAVLHREELFQLQTPLYKKFKQRSWKIVANEYKDLLSLFALNQLEVGT